MKLRDICSNIAASYFKPGDIVECMDGINASGWALKNGNFYTILKIPTARDSDGNEFKYLRFLEGAYGCYANVFRMFRKK